MKTQKTTLVFILMTVLTLTAYAQQYDPESDFEVTKQADGKSITITKYVSSKQTVNIPPTIQGLPVTSIGKEAFALKNIDSVNIPNSVVTIEFWAFRNCRNLISINIPKSVTTIVDRAIFGCTKLIAINVDNGNINYSSADGVLYNKNKTILIKYPQGKTDNSFTIPDSVTTIWEWAFDGCTSLASLTIPDNVTRIKEYAFNNMEWFNNQPNGLVYAGKVVYTYKGDMPANTSIILLNGTKGIADKAFYGKSLANITIPNSVTSIGSNAFGDCTSLNSVTIPDNITSIGQSAFGYCISLANITISNSVTSIGSQAFYSCFSLTSVTFERADTAIADDNSFPSGNSLRTAYNAGGAGTYTRPDTSSTTWTKKSN